MSALLEFFATMPTWQKLAWVAICLAVSWTLEGFIPLLRLDYRKWRHAAVNFVFLATSLLVGVGFALATAAIGAWTAASGFGLLRLVDFPVAFELALAIIILDFVAQYIAHVALHKLPLLWRFHMIHHSDTKVDATTGVRLHPGDIAVREVFALATLAALGAPLGRVLQHDRSDRRP